MVVEVKQKQALVDQANAELEQARQTAAAAEASLRSVEAKVKEAEASRLRAQAEYRRMKSQYARLSKAGNSGILDKDNVEEVRFGFEAAEAGLEEVEARIKSAQAARDEMNAKLNKARADIAVAEAHLFVASQNRDYAQVLLDYLTLKAPFDGVVTRRNINTDDFVQPAAASKGEPLYVVERRDHVRVFVEVPEADALWVNEKATGHVRVQALPGQEFIRKVARTSYSLDRTARTLMAEIDLPNDDDRLRPNMYAHATITAEYPAARTLPLSAIATQGDVTQGYQTYCFVIENGKARRTLILAGPRDSERVEVLKKQVKPAKPGTEAVWENFTGQEVIIRDNLSALKDGQAVSIPPGKD
jgi:RND family efflux transporter MFP subunit